MSDVVITIKLPEALVERAKAAGIRLDAQVEAQTEQLIATLEKEIKRAEAAKSLIGLMDKADSLADDLKPSPDEVEAEIRSVRAGRRHNRTEGSGE